MKTIILAILILSSQMVMGADLPLSKPPAPAAITLNPEVIRQELLERNFSIVQAMLQVHDAKDHVSSARGKYLLPSISLQGLASLSAGPTFALSQITALLPFLFPSNWFNYFAQTHTYEAQLVSYKILELNTYSMALSTYYTVLADAQYAKVYEQKAKDLQDIATIKKRQRELLGLASQEDVKQAEATAQLAQVQAKAFTELVVQENAAIRQEFGYPLGTDIIKEEVNMPASEWETKALQDTVNQAMLVAPEMYQINELVAAAKDEKWAIAFGFLGTASVSASSTGSVNSGSPSNASFSNLRGSANASIGFDYGPNIRLSNRNVLEIQRQQIALTEETTRVIEAGVGSVKQAQGQLDLATAAEDSLKSVYAARVREYQMGLTSLVTVLVARSQLAAASVARIQAQTDLNQLRVTLHRALLTDQFNNIKGCDASVLRQKSKPSWFKNLFKSGHVKLEEICREGVVPAN